MGCSKKKIEYDLGPLIFVRQGEEADRLLFLRSDSSILSVSGLSTSKTPDFYLKKHSFSIWNICFLKNYIGAAGRDGNLYLLDKKSLDIVTKIPLNASVKNVMEDNNGNIWVSTDDKGIIKLGDPEFKTQANLVKDLNYIQSIYVNPEQLLAGTSSGTLLEINRKTNSLKKYDLQKDLKNNLYIDSRRMVK